MHSAVDSGHALAARVKGDFMHARIENRKRVLIYSSFKCCDLHGSLGLVSQAGPGWVFQ